jgi:hypothetical protein
MAKKETTQAQINKAIATARKIEAKINKGLGGKKQV